MLIWRNISRKIVRFPVCNKSVHSRLMVFFVLCKSTCVVPSGGERLHAVARAGCRLARGCLISTHKPRSAHPPGADVDKEPEQEDACSSYSASLRPPTVHRLGKTNRLPDLTVSHKGSLSFALFSYLAPLHPPLALRLMLIIWCSFLPVKRALWLFLCSLCYFGFVCAW